MNKNKYIKLSAGAAAVMLCGILYFCTDFSGSAGSVLPDSEVEESFSGRTGNPAAEGGGEIYIHVCGEVKKPGVYRFSSEPRVIDVVEKAGGFTKKADRSSINQAAAVTDGTQLVVAGKQKKKDKDKAAGGDSAGLAGSAGAGTGKVNINTASKEELMALSGIGESKADLILSYREEYGTFKKTEDIMKVSGIKEGVFSRIKDQISI